MGNKYKLNKKCLTCNKLLLDRNKSGFCNQHRDRTGKNNAFFGKKHTQETLKQIKETCKIQTKKLWQNKEYCKKVIKAVSKPRSEEGKQNISKGIKAGYTKELKQLRGEDMKGYWKDGKIFKNGYSSNKSKYEKLLCEELKQNLPNETIVNNFVIKDNKKWMFPDITLPDRKIVIEFYGDYWHANPKKYKANDKIKHSIAKDIWLGDKERIEKLKKYGYKTFVVWQFDYLNNKEETIKKLCEQLQK